MNILIIAPHPDDEVIGCGGAIRLRVERGERVSALYLTSGELGLKHLPREKAWKIRETEARKAAKILGLTKLHFLRQPDWMLSDHAAATAKRVRAALEESTPDVIYLPHPNDDHPDHRATLPILRAALKHCRRLNPELLAYEVWTPLNTHDVTLDISRVMPRKMRALKAHRSQLGEFDYVRAVTGLNQFRGALAGKCRFAEVFQTIDRGG
jgi:LmbE family N-acetylglucosaminyl deacetylase